MRLQVLGLGFRLRFWCRVQGSGFRVHGVVLGVGVEGLRFLFEGFGLRVEG